MNHFQYKEILINQAKASIIVLVVAFVMIGILIYMNTTSSFKEMKNGAKVISNFLVIVIIIAAIIYSASYIYNTICDIKNESYVEYVGEFSIENNNEEFIYIYQGDNELILNYKEANYMAAGTYVGRLVYSQRTKCVLELEILS